MGRMITGNNAIRSTEYSVLYQLCLPSFGLDHFQKGWSSQDPGVISVKMGGRNLLPAAWPR